MSRDTIILKVSPGSHCKFSLSGFDDHSRDVMVSLTKEMGHQNLFKSKSLFSTMLDESDIEIRCSNDDEVKFANDTINNYLEFNRCEDAYNVIVNKYEEDAGVLVQKTIEPIKEIDIHDALKEYVENYDNAHEYFIKKENNHPLVPKLLLSREITERFHGKGAARKAFDEWIYEFNNRKPLEIKEKTIWCHEGSIKLKNLLKDCGLVASTSEALRATKQKSVKIDDVLVEGDVSIEADNIYRVYQIGKKRFLKVRVLKSKGYA